MLYCDTHVHCYNTSEFADLLDRAHDNFIAAIKNSDTDEKLNNARALMFFTDGFKDKAWSYISPIAQSLGSIGCWQFRPSSDGKLIVAENGEKLISLAPARQINSSHRLEFLLLGCNDEIPGNLTEQAIIETYAERCVLICPWGVGKWLGKRGELLSKLLSENKDKFFLGDNGSRPGIWRKVSQFQQSGLPILNGSDPLPLPGEINRVGSFGIRLAYTPETPGDDLSLQLVLDEIKAKRTVNYGKPVSLIHFIFSQLRLTLKK